jgi:FHA domain
MAATLHSDPKLKTTRSALWWQWAVVLTPGILFWFWRLPSRKHAHIRFEDGDYRICDDGSEFGTRVSRDGRPVDVPSGNRRGEKLRHGDEIYLGRARLRFER